MHERIAANGGELMFAGTHDNAYHMLERAGLVEKIGRQNFFWSSDQVIVESEKRACPVCQTQAE